MFVRLLDVERRKLSQPPRPGVGYTQVPEYPLTGIFHGAAWNRRLLVSLHFSRLIYQV